jgi:prepilin-type processing-associated H-X9-DG protein
MRMQNVLKFFFIFSRLHLNTLTYNIYDGYFLTAEVNTLNKTKISLHGCSVGVAIAFADGHVLLTTHDLFVIHVARKKKYILPKFDNLL